MLSILQNSGSWFHLVWTADPGNLPVIGNGGENETGENMSGMPWWHHSTSVHTSKIWLTVFYYMDF